jgi:hypothetical protein
MVWRCYRRRKRALRACMLYSVKHRGFLKMPSTTFTTLHHDDGDCNTSYLKQCSKWRVDYKIEFCDCNESWLSTAFPGVIDCFSQLSSSLPLLCGLTNVDTGIMIGLMHIGQKQGILEATMKWSSDSESRKTCARCIYTCIDIDSRQKICYQFIWFRSISQFQKISNQKWQLKTWPCLPNTCLNRCRSREYYIFGDRSDTQETDTLLRMKK